MGHNQEAHGELDASVRERIFAKLGGLCRRSDLVLVRDLQGLLQLPAAFSLPDGSRSHRVLRCEGDLSFRLDYEPLRHSPESLIVHQVAGDVFIPDVEERAARAGSILEVGDALLLEPASPSEGGIACGEGKLWMGELNLAEEYAEGEPGKLAFSLRQEGGERPFRAEVVLTGLAETAPLEVVVGSEEKAVEIAFTPVAGQLSEGERERGWLEREVSVAVCLPGEEGAPLLRRRAVLRLRLEGARVVRRRNPALEAILSGKPIASGRKDQPRGFSPRRGNGQP